MNKNIKGLRGSGYTKTKRCLNNKCLMTFAGHQARITIYKEKH